jgi:hypothetical protein
MRKLGASAIVELAVPLDLFDEPAHQWPLNERPSQRPRDATAAEEAALGRRHPVVLREVDRFGKQVYREETGPWWNRLGGLQKIPLIWVGCGDRVTYNEMFDHLRNSEAYQRDYVGLTLPAISDVGYPVMDAALYALVPIAVWRRVRCKEHSQLGTDFPGPCAGERFQAAIAAAVAEAAVPELPRIIMQVRNGNWCPETRDLVLLWDNPWRGPLPSRMS